MTSSDPRAAVNAYGQWSPPLSVKNTMASPNTAGASPARFPQATSPSPGPYNQVDVFQYPTYTESPSPIKPSPYPTPSSQSTMDAPADIDPTVWARAVQQAQRVQQQQIFQQPPPNMPPPNAFPPRQPYFAQQPYATQQFFPRDSGYGTGIYDNLGQAHGLPGQQSQSFATKPGHTYGKVTATGKARIIRGNARDTTRPVANERQHQYGDAEIGDEVDFMDGDVTTEQMRDFYLRR